MNRRGVANPSLNPMMSYFITKISTAYPCSSFMLLLHPIYVSSKQRRTYSHTYYQYDNSPKHIANPCVNPQIIPSQIMSIIPWFKRSIRAKQEPLASELSMPGCDWAGAARFRRAWGCEFRINETFAIMKCDGKVENSIPIAWKFVLREGIETSDITPRKWCWFLRVNACI